MQKLKLFLGLFFLILCLESYAQLLPQTQYVINPYLYNPALAGVKRDMAFFLSYKKQWWGVEGSPDLATLTFEYPFEGRLTASSQLNYQTEGPFRVLNFMGTASYFLPLDDYAEHFLFFGMSLGVENSSINTSEISDPNDPALANATLGQTGVIGNAGIAYAYSGIRAGLSFPRLFARDIVVVEGNASNSFSPFDFWILNVSYLYNLNFFDLSIEPQLLYHADKFAGGQVEAMLTSYYQDYGFLGLSYRQNYGLSVYLGANINDMYTISYGYGFATTSATDLPFNNASHELGIRIKLANKLEAMQRRYPFYR